MRAGLLLGVSVLLIACETERSTTEGDAVTALTWGADAPSITDGTALAADTDRADGPAAPSPQNAGSESDASSVLLPGASEAHYDWLPGDYPPDLHGQSYLELSGLDGQSDKVRGYKVHVPLGYSDAQAAPVLFALHGYQQNAAMFGVDGSGWIAKSDAEGFILILPNGIQEDGLGGSWNAGTCCGAASEQHLDDVALIRAIYAEVGAHVHVDDSRVYATGLSNGGFMSYRLACEAADLFAAVAPVAGAIGTPELSPVGTNPDPDFTRCEPSQRVPVLAMHGNGDPIVPYGGMKPSLDHFADKNGCGLATQSASQPASGGDTTCVTYACPEGVEVTGCTIQDGGHCWFGDPGCGTGVPGIGNLFVGNNSDFMQATDAVWDFLKRFKR